LTSRKLRYRPAQSQQADTLAALDSGLRFSQLLFVGAAVFLVPLIVLPDSAFLDITSTSKVTTVRFFGSLLTGVLLSRLTVRLFVDRSWMSAQLSSLKSNRPEFYVLISISLVTLISLFSTVFSSATGTSLWGRNAAGFESGEYTALMSVIFAIGIYVTVRERNSFEWLWVVLAFTGALAALIGIFQYHGLAFLDIAQVHRSHVTGTAGNPNFFGALLILLAPISIAYLAYLAYRSELSIEKMRRRYWLVALFLVSGAFSLSLVATVARGPLIGCAFGLVVAVIIAFRSGRIHQRRNSMTVTFAGIALFGLGTGKIGRSI